MLIDWFTVGAQAVNFLLLVWLLRRFLYRPILVAIDAREHKIAAELSAADAKRAEAKQERDEFQRKNQEFDQQRAALLGTALEEARGEGQRLLEQAGRAADAMTVKRQEAFRNDANQLDQSISRRAKEEVFAITRKTLTDLADTSLEDSMADVFTRRLRTLNGQGKAGLVDALKSASDPALVRSAFALSGEQCATIQHAVNETFSADIPLRFETAPELVSGIELTTNGQKVAWTIADYLEALEHGVDELLKPKNPPARPPKATSQETVSDKNGS